MGVGGRGTEGDDKVVGGEVARVKSESGGGFQGGGEEKQH